MQFNDANYLTGRRMARHHTIQQPPPPHLRRKRQSNKNRPSNALQFYRNSLNNKMKTRSKRRITLEPELNIFRSDNSCAACFGIFSNSKKINLTKRRCSNVSTPICDIQPIESNIPSTTFPTNCNNHEQFPSTGLTTLIEPANETYNDLASFHPNVCLNESSELISTEFRNDNGRLVGFNHETPLKNCSFISLDSTDNAILNNSATSQQSTFTSYPEYVCNMNQPFDQSFNPSLDSSNLCQLASAYDYTHNDPTAFDNIHTTSNDYSLDDISLDYNLFNESSFSTSQFIENIATENDSCLQYMMLLKPYNTSCNHQTKLGFSDEVIRLDSFYTDPEEFNKQSIRQMIPISKFDCLKSLFQYSNCDLPYTLTSLWL